MSRCIFSIMKKILRFSAGNNIAYDYAVKHWDSSFVVFANNDLLFRDREFIRKVRREYEKSHFGILSPDVFHTTLKIHQSPIDENMVLPKNRVRRTILFNTLALWFYPLYYALLGKNSKDVALSVTDLSYRKNIAPMGACLIFSRELMDRKPVIFSPETYFYYEEYILKLLVPEEQRGYCISAGYPGASQSWQSYQKSGRSQKGYEVSDEKYSAGCKGLL